MSKSILQEQCLTGSYVLIDQCPEGSDTQKSEKRNHRVILLRYQALRYKTIDPRTLEILTTFIQDVFKTSEFLEVMEMSKTNPICNRGSTFQHFCYWPNFMPINLSKKHEKALYSSVVPYFAQLKDLNNIRPVLDPDEQQLMSWKKWAIKNYLRNRMFSPLSSKNREKFLAQLTITVLSTIRTTVKEDAT